MALIKCPECGHEVSDKASSCPNCGYPLRSAENPVLPDEPEKPELAKEPSAETATESVAESIPHEAPAPAKLPSDGENYMSRGKKKDHSAAAIIIAIIAILSVIAIVETVTEQKEETARKAADRAASAAASSSQTSSSQSSSSASSYSSSKYSEDDIQSSVYLLAEECVKSHLKAPSTAEFCSMSECAFQKGEDGVYMMTGTVDSENGYGAKLRETWGIMAQVSGEKVSLVMLQIGDDTYFD